MAWTPIRLELARTKDFPNGSPAHAYLLHLPLEAGGLIDETALRATPEKATVIRSWPHERDAHGYVIRTKSGWALSYRPGEEDDETVFHLETHSLRPGDYVTLTEPDGSTLPFRVSIQS